MNTKDEIKQTTQQEKAVEVDRKDDKRAMKIRLKTGVMAGAVIAVHL